MATTKKKTVKPSKPNARTYYPPRTFDDDLVALVALYKTNKWSFSNVDLAQLAKDGQDQRSERASFDAAQAAFNAQHAEFGTSQEARYQRFAAALNAARGAFRNDKGVSAQLEKFKRSAVRKSKPATPATGGATKPQA
jgi:hypothetical protein